MKHFVVTAIVFSTLAFADGEDKACTLLDSSKIKQAKFHCVDGTKIYHVLCNISAAPEMTTATLAVRDHVSGIELPRKDKEGKPLFAKCEERELFLIGGMNGEKMGMDVVEKHGHTYLVGSEIRGRDDLKLRSIEKSRVDLDLRGSELLAGPSTGFKCRDKSNNLLFAVVDKSKAKRAGTFSPSRAWQAIENGFKIIPISTVSEISCLWDPEAEEEYPL